MVEQERQGLAQTSIPISTEIPRFQATSGPSTTFPAIEILAPAFLTWKACNTFPQKQNGYYGVQIRVRLGDISADTARKLAKVIRRYAADDIRVTVNQGLLLRFVPEAALPYLYQQLKNLDLGDPGFDSLADITACPGTDTCALGVTNSTALTTELERVVRQEYPHLVGADYLKIKISGCMNSCGQHMAANIGFHGSSIKVDGRIVPAMQVVLGGGVGPDGEGLIAEKIIKIPTRRIPQALRQLLNDFQASRSEEELFNAYFLRQGKMYFYELLKALADKDTLTDADFFDWGQEHHYQQAIGVGECAGVALDVVGAIIEDAIEQVALGREALLDEQWADSIYYSYRGFVIGAKALLLGKDIKCNTHHGILRDFQTHFVETKAISVYHDFPAFVLEMRKVQSSLDFASSYFEQAKTFLAEVVRLREEQLAYSEEKPVVRDYYKA